jgi:hypothetical protein
MGTVTWPVKASFTAYVEALEDGAVTVHGVTRDEAGAFVFPATVTADAAVTRGAAHLTGHQGELDVRLTDLVVLRRDAQWWLDLGGTAIARLLDGPADGQDLEAGWTFDDVALTVDGSALFGSVYGPWARMDPLVVAAG